MLSWGYVRRALHPVLIKYWLNRRTKVSTSTRVEGFRLSVPPGVFHPRYFGSSSILARFVSSLDLKGKRFLEVGCGSGLVALSAARAGAHVIAVDINPDAVNCCSTNAADNGLIVDTRFSDLFSTLSHEMFDVIAWNPPFLPGKPTNLAESAFFGGAEFDVIKRFAAEVRDHLVPGGCTYTIVSADIDIGSIEDVFRQRSFAVSRVLSRKWGLRETMVILCAS
jgi:release factor glutamine methyltransferase